MLFFAINSLVAQLQFEGNQQFGRIYNIIHDPVIPSKLYATTQGNHIVQSIDNGQNWDVLFAYPANGALLDNLKYLNTNSLSFTVSTGITNYDNRVYVINISTQQITHMYTPPTMDNPNYAWISSYDILQSNPFYAVVHQGYRVGNISYARVYYTTDGGTTWSNIYYNFDNDSVFPNSVAIHPDDPQKLFIARGDSPTTVSGGLLVSDDAGVTWSEKVSGNTVSTVYFNPNNTDEMYMGTWIPSDTTTENLYKSTDAGDTWQEVPITWSDYILNNILDIKINPFNANNIIVLEENEIAISNDGGTTWSNQVFPDDDPSHYYYGMNASFSPFFTNQLIISANWYPFFSNDAGQTLTQLEIPFYPVANVGINGDNLYYGVQNGIVHKEIASTQESIYNTEPLNYFSSTPSNFVDEFTDGRIFSYIENFSGVELTVSNDYGQSNNSIYQGFSSDLLVDLETNPEDLDNIWVSFFDGGLFSIDFSDLNNVSVTQITMPESGPVTSIYFDDWSTDIFVVLNNKVFKSTDGGTSWLQISNNLQALVGSNYIYDLKSNYWNGYDLIAVGGNGIFKSQDNGANWTHVYTGNNVRKIQFSPLTEAHIAAAVYTSSNSSAKILYSENHGFSWNTITADELEYMGSNSMDFVFTNNSVDAYIASYDLGLVKYTIALSTLSVPEEEQQNSLVKVYPNPVSNVLNVKVQNQTISKIQLYNMLGDKVIETANSKLDMSQLATGAYILKVHANTGNTIIKRIIKD